MAVDGLFFAQLVHHDLGHVVAGLAPNVHHFVVALTNRHQTGHILLFDFFDFFFRAFNDGVLFLRHQHVINRDGDTCTGG